MVENEGDSDAVLVGPPSDEGGVLTVWSDGVHTVQVSVVTPGGRKRN